MNQRISQFHRNSQDFTKKEKEPKRKKSPPPVWCGEEGRIIVAEGNG
jgi:hypothetical protein